MTGAQLTTNVEQLRAEAANRPREEKEHLGQFLTPPGVAELVASLFQPLPLAARVRLLDPGAGIGSLTAAFLKWLIQQENRPASVEIVTVELDDTLTPMLKKTLKSCETVAHSLGFPLRAQVIQADFLELCNNETDLFSPTRALGEFTHVIMNPPYRKISSDSLERQLLSQRGIEVSNIYAGFVALATNLLSDSGELSAITPRSFCNGTYFKEFRRKFFASMVLQSAHVFASRQRAFAQDAVLQENVTFAAHSKHDAPRWIDSPGSPEQLLECQLHVLSRGSVHEDESEALFEVLCHEQFRSGQSEEIPLEVLRQLAATRFYFAQDNLIEATLDFRSVI